jgi:hypothetical protein
VTERVSIDWHFLSIGFLKSQIPVAGKISGVVEVKVNVNTLQQTTLECIGHVHEFSKCKSTGKGKCVRAPKDGICLDISLSTDTQDLQRHFPLNNMLSTLLSFVKLLEQRDVSRVVFKICVAAQVAVAVQVAIASNISMTFLG